MNIAIVKPVPDVMRIFLMVSLMMLITVLPKVKREYCILSLICLKS